MSDQEKKAVPHIEEEKLNDQMVIRREKMQQFADAGVYPFGQKYNWTHHAQDIKDRAEALEKDGTRRSVWQGDSWLCAATAKLLFVSCAI